MKKKNEKINKEDVQTKENNPIKKTSKKKKRKHPILRRIFKTLLILFILAIVAGARNIRSNTI